MILSIMYHDMQISQQEWTLQVCLTDSLDISHIISGLFWGVHVHQVDLEMALTQIVRCGG